MGGDILFAFGLLLVLCATLGGIAFSFGLLALLLARDAGHDVVEWVFEHVNAIEFRRVDGAVWFGGTELYFGDGEDVVDRGPDYASKDGVFALQLWRGVQRDLQMQNRRRETGDGC